MSEGTTTSGGSGPDSGTSPDAPAPAEIAGGPERSVLVGTNRTAQVSDGLRFLEEARRALNVAERACATLRGVEVRDREVNDAAARIQEAHGLLWQVSRRLAGDQELNDQAPLKMSIDYVAWVLADRRLDHWRAELLRVFAKADPVNRARLAQAFPEEAAALERWNSVHYGDVPEWREP